jgi:hypothetical protein
MFSVNVLRIASLVAALALMAGCSGSSASGHAKSSGSASATSVAIADVKVLSGESKAADPAVSSYLSTYAAVMRSVNAGKEEPGINDHLDAGWQANVLTALQSAWAGGSKAENLPILARVVSVTEISPTAKKAELCEWVPSTTPYAAGVVAPDTDKYWSKVEVTEQLVNNKWVLTDLNKHDATQKCDFPAPKVDKKKAKK